MFLVGSVMIFVGKNRNNDDLFRGEFNRQRFFFMGILLVIAAVVIWFYLMFFDNVDEGTMHYSDFFRNSGE